MGRPLSFAILALLVSRVGWLPSRTAGVVRAEPAGRGDICLRILSRSLLGASVASVASPDLASTASRAATQANAVSGVDQARITGRVTTSDGQAVPGAWVIAVPANGGIAAHTLSGPDGTYDVNGVAEGVYFVDFELTGFDVVRRNHVRTTTKVPAHADAELYVSPICECVSVTPKQPFQYRPGQVLSGLGEPLPHASLHVGGSRPEFALTDSEGRFAVRVPIDEAMAMTVAESGFQPATQQVSGAVGASVVFRLNPGNGAAVPDTERLRRPCCPGNFFTQGR